MKVLESKETSFSVAINDQIINFKNVSSVLNNLSFDAFGKNNRIVNFSLTDNAYDFSYFMDYVQNSTVISTDQKLWPLIFCGACLLVSAVDYYCDNEISGNVSACTASGQCSQVNSCSASCVPCGSQK